MLDNFTQTFLSDNRPLFIEEEMESIVRGSTCIHLFKLPIDVSEIKDYKVSYKQGLHTILEKSPIDCELESLDIGTYVKVVVEPKESRLFNWYNKYAFAQIAIMLQDDTVIYSHAYKIQILDTINDDAFKEEGIE